MKTLHRLSPRVKLLTDFYVFDTETKVDYKEWVRQRLIKDKNFKAPKKSKNKKAIYWGLNGRPESFVFGVIYGHNYHKVIYDRKEFIETLKESRFKGKKVFAHNLFYDGTTLYDNIFKFDPNAIFNGKLICFTNGNCQFADSSNIFGKIALEKIGIMLGILKPQLGGDNYFSENGIGASEINRCITDCQIVYEGLIQIFQAAGDIKITQASLSMTYFRRFHQKHKIDYNENTLHFFNSYFGGRTEAFEMGDTNSSVIDANSMYPFIMKTIKFPNPKTLKISKPTLTQFKNEILPNYEGCVYCEIDHHETTFGFLPYKSEGKLLFPTGRFSGCWNMPEIRFALEQGAIKIRSIEKVVYSERMPSPFVSFVDTLYTERFKTTNDFEIHRIKIFMNSLYGKFAQRIEEENTYLENVDNHYMEIMRAQANKTFVKLVYFNSNRNDAFLVTKTKKSFNISHSIPSFASYITSGARVHLLKQMLELENRKVVYCDTDSVFFENAFGIENDKALGGWKIEKKIITAVHGLKNYEYINEEGIKKHRIKGVPEKAIEVRPNYFEYENLLNTKEALRRNLLPGVLTKRTKNITGKYDKRIVNEDGTTKPIKII